ncbi:MAG: alkaline phosphatase PhoX [Bacteroidota bacterium]
MKKILTTLTVVGLFLTSLQAQRLFEEQLQMPEGFRPTEVVMPPSPLSIQVLFVGGTDMVQTTETYGNAAGETPAKEWHDFIGVTPDETGESLGWVSINHERIVRDDMIGDGGGMTAFRIKRADDGTLEVMDQTLEDGRSGKFFNVDFANTVGETGMNCGGICSTVDGRIWTAEEWFRRSNTGSGAIQFDGGAAGVRDISDYTIDSDIPGEWNGTTVEKYENFNYMVEIDPRQAKAIRKQYNWGRQPFEGGAVNESNQIVYLGPDSTPGIFGMFVAQTPGDFTKGTLFAYKHDKPGWPWVPIWEPGSWLNPTEVALSKGATMFNRIEWVAFNPVNNFVYFTATGRDNPGSRFAGGQEAGGTFHPAIQARAEAQGVSAPTDDAYWDYYGRIWEYNPSTGATRILLEGGANENNDIISANEESPAEADYPSTHLSNADGLNTMMIDGKPFLVIQEDLNGTSYGRMPAGADTRICEMYLLDLSIANPTLDDLIRITATPVGAEITGAQPTPDGKSLLVNVQHPSSDNPFPYNHSCTIAINGFDKLKSATMREAIETPFANVSNDTEAFKVFPNPTTRYVQMNQFTDVALYDLSGRRLMVQRNVDRLDVSQLAPGMYFIQNAKGETLKLSIK